jgi:hypothetical protein
MAFSEKIICALISFVDAISLTSIYNDILTLFTFHFPNSISANLCSITLQSKKR